RCDGDNAGPADLKLGTKDRALSQRVNGSDRDGEGPRVSRRAGNGSQPRIDDQAVGDGAGCKTPLVIGVAESVDKGKASRSRELHGGDGNARVSRRQLQLQDAEGAGLDGDRIGWRRHDNTDVGIRGGDGERKNAAYRRLAGDGAGLV